MFGTKAAALRQVQAELALSQRAAMKHQQIANRLNLYADELERELDVAVREYTSLEARYDALVAERDRRRGKEPPL
ncbi:hypothetical protein [Streptomyces sp. NRRL F-2580]|uniref:hypothetical protein n=1 Tax=Streptomyces sp. NRRL F-2580 TaxID=1463841 RepID=UPI0004C70C43|nr:hypothetical protein [Streptomyces sp. NRRL F-2580]